MSCEAELCEYWTGQGCICAVLDLRGDDDRQSTTACCPRETIPDSCSCPDGCACECLDCDCADLTDEELGAFDGAPGYG